ncbi:MAG: hypothetical protein ACREPL_02265 [Rhodanobacteraceae bacterium]
MNKSVLAAAIAADLTRKYGEVMQSSSLADALQLSRNALRLALSRGGDLPRRARLPGKGHRWLTRDVAEWIAARSTTPADHDTDGRLDAQAPNADIPRRPGRPRTVARVVQLGGNAPSPGVAADWKLTRLSTVWLTRGGTQNPRRRITFGGLRQGQIKIGR